MHDEMIADALFTIAAALIRIAEAMEEQNRLTARRLRSEASEAPVEPPAPTQPDPPAHSAAA
jgi:hypothetical protein